MQSSSTATRRGNGNSGVPLSKRHMQLRAAHAKQQLRAQDAGVHASRRTRCGWQPCRKQMAMEGDSNWPCSSALIMGDSFAQQIMGDSFVRCMEHPAACVSCLSHWPFGWPCCRVAARAQGGTSKTGKLGVQKGTQKTEGEEGAGWHQCVTGSNTCNNSTGFRQQQLHLRQQHLHHSLGCVDSASDSPCLCQQPQLHQAHVSWHKQQHLYQG